MKRVLSPVDHSVTNPESTKPVSSGPTMRALFNGVTIAESDDTVVVEGNHYFPRASVDPSVVVDSDTHTVCPWKGTASYQTVRVEGAEAVDGLWYYPDPKPEAVQITDRVAFWHGIEVVAAG